MNLNHGYWMVISFILISYICCNKHKYFFLILCPIGFPRTQPQAAALQKETPVNVVVNLDVPFETIIDRVKDRWVHPGSGRIYNTLFSPPKVEGKDDVTGEDLIQRDDDKPESVLNRLEIFSAQTKPVLEFYREMGICEDFQGTESKKIWPHVEAYLKTIIKS